MAKRTERLTRHRAAGFTLVEMVLSIVLMGILAGMTVVFIRMPISSNLTTRQRIALADSADAAQRLLDLELRRAVPDSVRRRQVGGRVYIEFLATRAVGRARSSGGGALCGGGPGGDALMPNTAAENCFTTLGPVITHDGSAVFPTGDYVVVGHVLNTPRDAYRNGAANNRSKARITAFTPAGAGPAPEARIRFANTNFLGWPVANPPPAQNRYYIVTGPVTYECNPATGQLRRYAGYAIAMVQPAPPAVTPSIVAANVSACNITYHNGPTDVGLRGRLLSLSVDFARAVPGENALEHAYLFAQIPASVVP